LFQSYNNTTFTNVYISANKYRPMLPVVISRAQEDDGRCCNVSSCGAGASIEFSVVVDVEVSTSESGDSVDDGVKVPSLRLGSSPSASDGLFPFSSLLNKTLHM
jgi:hypothetical protein